MWHLIKMVISSGVDKILTSRFKEMDNVTRNAVWSRHSDLKFNCSDLNGILIL